MVLFATAVLQIAQIPAAEALRKTIVAILLGSILGAILLIAAVWLTNRKCNRQVFSVDSFATAMVTAALAMLITRGIEALIVWPVETFAPSIAASSFFDGATTLLFVFVSIGTMARLTQKRHAPPYGPPPKLSDAIFFMLMYLGVAAWAFVIIRVLVSLTR